MDAPAGAEPHARRPFVQRHRAGRPGQVAFADELGDQAANALRAPFALGILDDVRHLLTPLGSDVRVDEIDGTARFDSIAGWVHTDVRGWTLADLVDDAAEAKLVARAERELARFVSTDGPSSSHPRQSLAPP